jgi:hypothetical protein
VSGSPAQLPPSLYEIMLTLPIHQERQGSWDCVFGELLVEGRSRSSGLNFGSAGPGPRRSFGVRSLDAEGYKRGTYPRLGPCSASRTHADVHRPSQLAPAAAHAGIIATAPHGIRTLMRFVQYGAAGHGHLFSLMSLSAAAVRRSSSFARLGPEHLAETAHNGFQRRCVISMSFNAHSSSPCSILRRASHS